MMRFLIVCISLFCLLLPADGYSQSVTPVYEIICGKKWYIEMIKDAEGNTSTPEAATEKDCMHFGCDSTFVLVEGSVVLKGKWTFDRTTMNIKMEQSQIATMPEAFSFHIVDYDESHLVLVGQEGTINEGTAHLIAR